MITTKCRALVLIVNFHNHFEKALTKKVCNAGPYLKCFETSYVLFGKTETYFIQFELY